MAKREIALHVAEKLLFTPYLWGGDDPSGFDCSGYMIECLKSVGVLPDKGDWTAQGLNDMPHWKHITEAEVRPGDLVFYAFGGSAINHVEMVYKTNPIFTIGSMGGGSRTISQQAAIEQNAYIRIRPLKGGISGFVNPYQD